MSRPLIRILGAALASFAWVAAAHAAEIDGRITFPGSDDPAVTVYVYSLDAARLRAAAVGPKRRDFRIEVPPGHYLVFAAPSEPGAPDVYGAYTRCSAAAGGAPGSTAAADRVASCADHGLRTVTLDARAHRAEVAIDDWTLSDADADALDRIRGVAATPGPQPAGAPRFSEYPAAPTAPDTATRAARPSLRRLAAAERARARDLAAAGPNFAGDVTTVVARCGDDCLRVLLIDWRLGKVVEPPELAAVDDSLPCRASEAVQFRRDSRLLSVTRMRGGAIVTQYFLWDPQAASLTLLAVYPRKGAQYCAIDPP